jgi:exosortase
MLIIFIALLAFSAFSPFLHVDVPYLFIIAIALLAWFGIKWERIASIKADSSRLSAATGISAIILDMAINVGLHSNIGLIDMLVFLCSSALIVYGFRSLKIFWVPVAYGLILLAGYQLENNVPNFVSLQDWMTSLMGNALGFLGINASTSGHLIYLNSGSGLLLLDVESSCTGIHGVIAFGMLSVMALFDIRMRLSRLIPLLAVGIIGAFGINLLRLLMVILTFNFLGVEAGTTMHLVVGYLLFVLWVVIFWGLSLKYFTRQNDKAAFILKGKEVNY